MVKRIILQHMTGDMRELDKLSVANIKNYATMVGADYRLLRGNVFSEKYRPPIQKVYMIDKEFDEYDEVLMLDIDMFSPKGNTKNVFDEPGIGLYDTVQQQLHRRLSKTHPQLASMNHPYWGGAIYKFNRQDRIHLRKGLEGDSSWIDIFQKPGYYGDEGIMCVLANKTKFVSDTPYFQNNKWCYCSFLPDVKNAGFIHMRTKKPGNPNGTWNNGGKQEKIENYKTLVKQGVLE